MVEFLPWKTFPVMVSPYPLIASFTITRLKLFTTLFGGVTLSANVDANIYQPAGIHIASACWTIEASYGPEVVEAFAILFVLRQCRQLGFSHIILESDCKGIVNKLQRHISYDTSAVIFCFALAILSKTHHIVLLNLVFFLVWTKYGGPTFLRVSGPSTKQSLYFNEMNVALFSLLRFSQWVCPKEV